MLAGQQQEEALAKKVYELGQTHRALVYQRLSTDLALVADELGKIKMMPTLPLTPGFRLTAFGIARYRRRILSKIAVPVGHTVLAELDVVLLQLIETRITTWSSPQSV